MSVVMQGANTEWNANIEAWTRALRAADRGAGTIRTRREHVLALSRWANVGLAQVTTTGLIDVLGERDWSRAYRRNFYTSVRQFFAWAHGTGLIDIDPASTLPRIGPSKNRGRPASEDSVWNASACARPREQLMLRLAYELGLRRAEVAVVNERDVVREVHSWVLVVHGKGSKDRSLPIDEGFAGVIREACDPRSGWLFPGKIDGHLSPQRVGNLVSRLLPDGETMHSLRHRFAAVYYEATGDTRVVQETLGHENLNTTQIYLPVSRARIQRALTTAAPLLAPQAPGSRQNLTYAPASPLRHPAASIEVG